MNLGVRIQNLILTSEFFLILTSEFFLILASEF